MHEYGSRLEDDPIELKSMHAFRAQCQHCGSYVVMGRDKQDKLNPSHCWCIRCGQRYYMNIPDIIEWENEQWEKMVASL